MYIVSRIDPHYPERRHDRLWLLVGEGPDFHDGAKAYQLGLDRGRAIELRQRQKHEKDHHVERVLRGIWRDHGAADVDLYFRVHFHFRRLPVRRPD